jgi:predicted GTPase
MEMQIAKSKSSMNHPEVVIARQAIEEGRGLVVIVNKMDLLRENQRLLDKVLEAVPKEIQTVIPQVRFLIILFLVCNILFFNIKEILMIIHHYGTVKRSIRYS